MNKSELINKMAEDATITKAQATDALESFFDAVTTTLNKDEKLSLIGFGTFSRTHRKAREAKNPRNPSETIQIPAKKVAKFKAGKKLTESIA